jgi:plasmid stabilization system protein ParE
MKRVVYAKTFEADFSFLLKQGLERFGSEIVAEKAVAVLDAVDTLLARQPGLGKPVAGLSLMRYHINKTPFVVLYDVRDNDLRVHTVVHARSDIPNTNLTHVSWD